MKKILKWSAIIVAALVVLLFGGYKYMMAETKKASPENTVEYAKNGKELSIFYCMPSKKGREIFGDLVPYGKVWRTGANEATTFTSNKDLKINGETLPAGKYSLWTIPEKDQWTIIWNKKDYGWGVDFNSNALREEEHDVLLVKVPVQELDQTVERLIIDFEEKENLNLVFAWDKTKVAVPIE